MGQYGPTCPGNPGIDGNYGNVYSVTYEAAIRGSASIPTSRPKQHTDALDSSLANQPAIFARKHFCRLFRLGLPYLEAGLLFGKSPREEISGILCDEAELRRSELHLPQPAQREYDCVMARCHWA